MNYCNKKQVGLSLVLAAGVAFLVNFELGAEVYTQTNSMPSLTSSPELANISEKLYELRRRSGAQQEGIAALMDSKLWEQWVKGGVAAAAVKKAVSYKDLEDLRNKVLEQVNAMAKIFAAVTKAKKGKKAALVAAKTIESKIQELVGAGLKKPCDATTNTTACQQESFQEQWSLLKALAPGFNQFLRTLEPIFTTADVSQAFASLKSAMVTKNTNLFAGSLDANVLGYSSNSVVSNNAEKISKNIFLSLPLMTHNDEASFVAYLDKVSDFIGTRDKQRAKDTETIITYWKAVVDGLQKSFKALHKLQDKKGSEKIKADKINPALLPWSSQLDDGVRAVFNWVSVALAQVNAIKKRSEAEQKNCHFQDCRQRYELLVFVSSYLETVLEGIQRSMKELRAIR